MPGFNTTSQRVHHRQDCSRRKKVRVYFKYPATLLVYTLYRTKIIEDVAVENGVELMTVKKRGDVIWSREQPVN